MITFQTILSKLSAFWEKQGCIIHQGYDLEVGAGTFNPATFLRSLGPEPYRAAYIEPSRRPTDGRYGTNPIRMQHYFQYQVILKPAPFNIQDLYLESLEAIGFRLSDHDIRFVHDDWESPTLGAWGLGWEVWMDGMEVTQFTYFQSVGGVELRPITGEITYGIERLASYLMNVNSSFDLQWSQDLTYGDIYHRNEVEMSTYNFEYASVDMWLRHFQDYEKEAKKLLDLNLPLPAYDFVLKASHAFNMLDARSAISVSERTGYIGRIRALACLVAQKYIESREEQKFPLLGRFQAKSFEKATLPALSEQLMHPKADAKADFLLEIGSEELPATFVPIGCANLEKGMRQLLEKENIPLDQIMTYGTPRRLSIYIKQLQLSKQSQTLEKRGPSVEQGFDAEGKPTQSLLGFLRSHRLAAASLQEIRSQNVPYLEIRELKGTEYLFAKVTTEGTNTAQMLANELPNLILNIDFPKKMRWADLDISYARPLRWIVALLDKEVIPFQIGNIQSDRISRGHRQLENTAISLTDASHYVQSLKEKRVLVDAFERASSIHQQLEKIEKDQNVRILEKEKVMRQVVNLVEWPQVAVADFDTSYLKVPQEVLISEMVEHQKYFPVANEDGKLKNLFVITADNTPTERIRKGNQKVLISRLRDGLFLYETDLKEPLEKWNEKLKQVTYLQGLGSIYDKVERITKEAAYLQNILQIGDLKTIERAAYLCKADLASMMVYEFPELQGTMGKYYALAKGESQDVAQAIYEHWMPKGENAPLPQSDAGVILALADKVDNLLSCFLLGFKPSSSSDPYALRRQALGIIKILIQGRFQLSLPELFEHCLTCFPTPWNQKKEVVDELLQFFINRIKTVFTDYGLTKDEIEASLSSHVTDIFDIYCRAEALHQFRLQDQRFPLLCEVYKRAKGQLVNHKDVIFDQKVLCEKEEIELYQFLESKKNSFLKAIEDKHYGQAYGIIASIQPYLASLFDRVKILADDPALQNNRIALLQQVFTLFGQLLDFSKIVITKT